MKKRAFRDQVAKEGVDEDVIATEVEHLLSADSYQKGWVPLSFERQLFKTIYALVLIIVQEITSDMKIQVLADSIMIHVCPGPAPPKEKRLTTKEKKQLLDEERKEKSKKRWEYFGFSSKNKATPTESTVEASVEEADRMSEKVESSNQKDDKDDEGKAIQEGTEMDAKVVRERLIEEAIRKKKEAASLFPFPLTEIHVVGAFALGIISGFLLQLFIFGGKRPS